MERDDKAPTRRSGAGFRLGGVFDPAASERRLRAVVEGLDALLAEPDSPGVDDEVRDLVGLLDGRADRAALLSLWEAGARHGEAETQRERLLRLRRAVEARRRSVRQERRQAAAPATPSGDALPGEDALLGRVADRFYGSWAFKGLGVAMLAAVGLAAGGTLLLGGQGLQLSQQLEQRHAQAERRHAELEARQAAELLRHGEAFARDAEAARQRARELLGDLDARLKAAASEQIVAGLRRELDERSGTMRATLDSLDGEMATLRGIAVRVDQALAETGKRSVRSTEELARLAGAVATGEAQVKAIAGRLEAIAAQTGVVEQRSAPLAARLARVELAMGELERRLEVAQGRAAEPAGGTGLVTPVAAAVPVDPVRIACTVQLRLNELGFRQGYADGVIGSVTSDAIRRWQASRAMNPTGVLSDSVRAELIGGGPLRDCPPRVRSAESVRPRAGAR